MNIGYQKAEKASFKLICRGYRIALRASYKIMKEI